MIPYESLRPYMCKYECALLNHKLAYVSIFHSPFLSGLDDDETSPSLITSSSFLMPSAPRNYNLGAEATKVRRTPDVCTPPGNVLSTMFAVGNPYKRMPTSYKD